MNSCVSSEALYNYKVIKGSPHDTLLPIQSTSRCFFVRCMCSDSDTYKESDLFNIYSVEGLEDHINFAATAREIMGLIAEGDIR